MTRTGRILLKVETTLAVPTFILAWFLASVVFAWRAGWKCAQLTGAKKTELLEATFGKPEPAEK